MEEKESNKLFLKRTILFFLILIFIVCSILLYSRYVGIKGLEVKEYKIVNKDLNDSFYGLKIVHISDIHYGRITFKKELNEVVKKINLLKPDIVVLTGDLIDKDTNLNEKTAKEISKELNKIDSNIGKFAIKGEHDCKFDNWQIIIENGGFVDLNDKYDLIYGNNKDYILLAGMSSNIDSEKKVKEKDQIVIDYLNSVEESNKPNYSILLMHEGDYINDLDISKYNLILAGHSHNGQVILPIIGQTMLPEKGKIYYDNYYKKNTTDIYISSGIGVSNSNFRLFNKPSINFYRLTNR